MTKEEWFESAKEDKLDNQSIQNWKLNNDINITNNNDWNALFYTILYNSKNSFYNLLNNNINPNFINKNKHSALTWCCYTGNIDFFNELLKYKPDLYQITINNESLLHIASHKKNIYIIKFLIQNNINIEHKNNKGVKAFYYIKNDTDIIKEILKTKYYTNKILNTKNININSKNILNKFSY